MVKKLFLTCIQKYKQYIQYIQLCLDYMQITKKLQALQNVVNQNKIINQNILISVVISLLEYYKAFFTQVFFKSRRSDRHPRIQDATKNMTTGR